VLTDVVNIVIAKLNLPPKLFQNEMVGFASLYPPYARFMLWMSIHLNGFIELLSLLLLFGYFLDFFMTF